MYLPIYDLWVQDEPEPSSELLEQCLEIICRAVDEDSAYDLDFTR